jgi:voltage-gated potassium channel
VTAVAGALVLVCAASAIYFAEHGAQPDAFSSIPAALWWGIETLTTVGYGDIYPVTVAGKLLASVIAVLGVGLFVLPAGIIASGFADEMRRGKLPPRENRCPHCGKALDERPAAQPLSAQRQLDVRSSCATATRYVAQPVSRRPHLATRSA